MAYLFDTDAISEVLKKRPQKTYLRWLATIAREDQFTSTVSIGELYRGAFRSAACDRHLNNIRTRVLSAITPLPFDTGVAEVYGSISATLEQAGRPLADADLQIAATALYHDLALVTGNLRHFERVPNLRLEPILAEARGRE